MKKIYQLKALMYFILWISMAVLAFTIVAVVIGAFFPSQINFGIRGQNVEEIDLALGILIGLVAIGYGFFIYALFQLKKLVDKFVIREFFTADTVRLCKSTGVNLLYSAALIHIPSFFYDMIAENNLSIKFGSINPESIFFLIIIGLFFVTLSHIFNEAKVIKDENEYTV
jgi:hypothetical protein